MSPRRLPPVVPPGTAGAARPGRVMLIAGPFIAGSVIVFAGVYLAARYADPGPVAFPHPASAAGLPRYLWVTLPDAAFGNWLHLFALVAFVYAACYFAGGVVHYWRAGRRRGREARPGAWPPGGPGDAGDPRYWQPGPPRAGVGGTAHRLPRPGWQGGAAGASGPGPDDPLAGYGTQEPHDRRLGPPGQGRRGPR